jgi:hypothetical protein
MNDPFRTPEDYELFLYTLTERFPSIHRSTLTFVRRGHSLARVSGEIFFADKIRLVILERLVFDRLPILIDPHHRHVLLDIKHNRIPAPTRGS